MYISELQHQLKGGERKEGRQYIHFHKATLSNYNNYRFKSLFSKRLQNDVM